MIPSLSKLTKENYPLGQITKEYDYQRANNFPFDKLYTL